MASIVLNGTSLTPTTINTSLRKVGVRLDMANGGFRYFHRAHKRTWELHWNLIGLTLRDSILNIFTTNSTMTYTDENSVIYTVIPVNEASVEFGANHINLKGFKYYNLTITLEEV